MKPHKHAELIKAWADGAVIQYRNGNSWVDLQTAPTWRIDYEYRIKPREFPKSSLTDRVLSYMWDRAGGSTVVINYGRKVADAAVRQYILDTEV